MDTLASEGSVLAVLCSQSSLISSTNSSRGEVTK